MRWALVVASLLTAVTFSADGSALAENAARGPERTTAAQAGMLYYIEFRVARIGTYGHSYVAHGRFNANGQPAEHRYTDLHPIGNYALMALGHVLPVPANTKWDPEVLALPVSSSYRRKLTAAQYKKLWRRSSACNPNSATGTPSPIIAIIMLENWRERLDCERPETFSFLMPSSRHCGK